MRAGSFTGGGYLGGPTYDWMHRREPYELLSVRGFVRAALVGAMVIGTGVGIIVAAILYFPSTGGFDRAMEICQRRMLWDGIETHYLPDDWGERCARVKALAAKQAVDLAIKREVSDQAYVDGVLARAH